MAVRIVTARQRADLNLPKTVSAPSLLVDRDRANMACCGAHYKFVVEHKEANADSAAGSEKILFAELARQWQALPMS